MKSINSSGHDLCYIFKTELFAQFFRQFFSIVLVIYAGVHQIIYIFSLHMCLTCSLDFDIGFKRFINLSKQTIAIIKRD